MFTAHEYTEKAEPPLSLETGDGLLFTLPNHKKAVLRPTQFTADSVLVVLKIGLVELRLMCGLCVLELLVSLNLCS